MPIPIDGLGLDRQYGNSRLNTVGMAPSTPTQVNGGIVGQGADIRESNFGDILSDAITNIEARQRNAQVLGIRAVTGRTADVHDYMIAATEAKLTIELASAIRNKAVDAFNEIMRLQA